MFISVKKNLHANRCSVMLKTKRKSFHESRWFEGKRAQIIDIHYKGVGVLKEISPEEMEEQFKEHYLNKRKNGIA